VSRRCDDWRNAARRFTRLRGRAQAKKGKTSVVRAARSGGAEKTTTGAPRRAQNAWRGDRARGRWKRAPLQL